MNGDLSDLGDLTVEQFLAAVAAPSPTPGGGGAAAITLALGAALIEMACGFALGRKRYAQAQADLLRITERCQAIRRRALELARLDVAAFAEVGCALKLPKSTDQERETRRLAVSTAAMAATEAPLQIADLCRETAGLAGEAAAKGNPNLVDDAAGGAALARGAARICQLNVNANLALISEQDFINQARGRITRAAAVLQEADAVVDRYLWPAAT